jgi:molybdate transport system ATP-binding protein
MLRVDVVKRRGDFNLRVAFAAPTPGIVALFGRSGCGKTTLVDIIAGLLQPDEGGVWLGGLELSAPPERRGIGYVFQDARLFPHYNVAGNLQYGQKRAATDCGSNSFDEVVSLLGLSPLLDRKPNQLSGGERQRVALGRALLCQPRLLLLDEPVASLDVARREEVMPYLEKLRDSLSIPMVYVSHQLDEVLRLATHVVLLDAGSVIAQGSPVQISLDPQLGSIVGRESIGAVLEGVIASFDSRSRLAELQVGRGRLSISVNNARVGSSVRVQLLARDIILSAEMPRSLSVRNVIEGRIDEIADDGSDARLIRVDIGGPVVLARVTSNAVEELGLRPGMTIWVLVKAVSARIL